MDIYRNFYKKLINLVIFWHHFEPLKFECKVSQENIPLRFLNARKSRSIVECLLRIYKLLPHMCLFLLNSIFQFLLCINM